MNGFANMNIGGKITAGFFSIAVLLAVVGYIGIAGMTRIEQEMTAIHGGHVVALVHLKNADEHLNRNLTSLRNALLHKEHGNEQAYLEARRLFAAERAGFHRHLAAYSALTTGQQNGGKAAQLSTLMQEFEQRQDRVMALLEENTTDAAYQQVFENIDIIGAIHAELAALNETEQRAMDAAVVRGDTILRQSRELMVAFAVLGVIAALLLGRIIASAISTPVNALVQVAEDIARGKLADSIEVTSDDEIGKLQASMRTMSTSLNNMASAARAIADGDPGVKITPQSEDDVLGNALADMLEELNRMISIAYETNLLALNVALENVRNDDARHAAALAAASASPASAMPPHTAPSMGRKPAFETRETTAFSAAPAGRLAASSPYGKDFKPF